MYKWGAPRTKPSATALLEGERHLGENKEMGEGGYKKGGWSKLTQLTKRFRRPAQNSTEETDAPHSHRVENNIEMRCLEVLVH